MRRKTVGNKVVSVLLAGALAASLAACGGNTANTGADAGNNAADAGTKEDTKSAETETAADTEESSDAAVADSGYEAKDLGGRTIKIGLWWDEYWDSNYQSLDDIEAAGGSWTLAKTVYPCPFYGRSDCHAFSATLPGALRCNSALRADVRDYHSAAGLDGAPYSRLG